MWVWYWLDISRFLWASRKFDWTWGFCYWHRLLTLSIFSWDPNCLDNRTRLPLQFRCYLCEEGYCCSCLIAWSSFCWCLFHIGNCKTFDVLHLTVFVYKLISQLCDKISSIFEVDIFNLHLNIQWKLLLHCIWSVLIITASDTNDLLALSLVEILDEFI